MTGKGEGRSARQVGVFYGFQEAGSQFRRASVAAIGELVHPDVERGGGRKLCIELEGERVVWEDPTEEDGGVEGILKRRNRSAFAEELFAKLVGEVKGDATLRAKYKVGNQVTGESIEVTLSNGESFTISMVRLFFSFSCRSYLTCLVFLRLRRRRKSQAPRPPLPRQSLSSLPSYDFSS